MKCGVALIFQLVAGLLRTVPHHHLAHPITPVIDNMAHRHRGPFAGEYTVQVSARPMVLTSRPGSLTRATNCRSVLRLAADSATLRSAYAGW